MAMAYSLTNPRKPFKAHVWLASAKHWFSELVCCAGVIACGAVNVASAQTGDVTVAVASNFTAPMQQVAQAFERDTGYQTRLSFGGTGALYAQIKNGAPFDVFLAADSKTPAKLAREGIADASSQFTYATGQLVLWSTKPTLVDAKGEVLRQGDFARIAMADPELAPYGAAARQVLQHRGLWHTMAPKIVQGKNIGQTFQFVSSGNVALGFVALSQVYKNGAIQSGSGWVVPDDQYAPIKQDAILLNVGRDNHAARALMDYLQSDSARAIIESYGYQVRGKP